MVATGKHDGAYKAADRSRVHETDAAAQDAEKRMGAVATFRMLCQGRDGKLCLFEDANGHLTAVRADRLA